ncbi:hypothetical protein VPH35_065705 [Triticum aestivum]
MRPCVPCLLPAKFVVAVLSLLGERLASALRTSQARPGLTLCMDRATASSPSCSSATPAPVPSALDLPLPAAASPVRHRAPAGQAQLPSSSCLAGSEVVPSVPAVFRDQDPAPPAVSCLCLTPPRRRCRIFIRRRVLHQLEPPRLSHPLPASSASRTRPASSLARPCPLTRRPPCGPLQQA